MREFLHFQFEVLEVAAKGLDVSHILDQYRSDTWVLGRQLGLRENVSGSDLSHLLPSWHGGVDLFIHVFKCVHVFLSSRTSSAPGAFSQRQVISAVRLVLLCAIRDEFPPASRNDRQGQNQQR